MGRQHDRLPDRVFEPLPEGPAEGSKVDPTELEEAVTQYYQMMNWDTENGHPTRGKLCELGLGWVAETLNLP